MNRLFLLLISLSLSCYSSQSNHPPNVVFILVDDLGWKDLSCYGSSFYESPNLDRLAKDAIRFTNAYAASPVCSPTRAAIMTGKHPARINITDWIPGMAMARAENATLVPPEDIHNLPLAEHTLAEAFHEGNYRTFFAGKWHLGETESHWPQQHGFDENQGGNHWGAPRRSDHANGYYSPYGNPQLPDGPVGEYLTDRLTNESLKFLEKSIGDPFLLYLAFYTVHTPIQGCQKYDSLYQQRSAALPDSGRIVTTDEHSGITRTNQSNPLYAAMVRSMDENVGRLLDRLRELDLYDNTIIVFTSDNGGLSTLKRPGPTAVRPLRAGKGWCYEGGVRVPLMIKPVSSQTAGLISDVPVISMDLYPTLLELAGLPMQPSQHVDGVSLVPLIQNPGETLTRSLIWHYPHYHGSTWRPGSAIRTGNFKLIEFYEEDKVELYDLSVDLGESSDLTSAMPEKAEELRSLLHQKLDEMGAKYPTRR